MNQSIIQPDAQLDLVLERVVGVPKELVWVAWTTPEHVKKWFAPAPWTIADCEIDLRPGGIFRTVMRSPDGLDFPNIGCYLEIVKNEKLAWTTALGPGYRPTVASAANPAPFLFSAVISLEAQGNGTKYTATVIHGDEATCKQHDAMGFHTGWGTALDQLVAMAKAL